MSNPWLSIPASDYENHMNNSLVRQTQMLNECFARVVQEFNPEALAVVGSSTGNGFEHLESGKTNLVKAIDINPEYCKILENRFFGKINGLNIECADIDEVDLPLKTFDLVHCALIFEYVNVSIVLQKIKNSLKPGGKLTVVLQQSTPETDPVTRTQYRSLEKLGKIMQIIPCNIFDEMATQAGFRKVRHNNFHLVSGKVFYFGVYE